MDREAKITRVTRETEIALRFNLDGDGRSDISTGLPFMDHMLNLFSAHGLFDLEIRCKGDISVDFHHTVEDLGICLGSALRDCLGERKGIVRYGEATIPMDEALARVIIDLSNRPYLAYRVGLSRSMAGTFDVALMKEFFRAVATKGGITMHADLLFGDDPHHASEAVFKAFARALDKASTMEPRLGEKVPSTKGVI